jgi:hypothetical protein
LSRHIEQDQASRSRDSAFQSSPTAGEASPYGGMEADAGRRERGDVGEGGGIEGVEERLGGLEDREVVAAVAMNTAVDVDVSNRRESERGVLREAGPFGIRAVDEGVVVAVEMEDEDSVESKGRFLAGEAVADGLIEAEDRTTDNHINRCRGTREE